MSNINTSNITVPSVATMVQHLVDSNPHPQYMLGTGLISSVKANVHLGDLADVTLGTGLQDNSLIVYKAGLWVDIPAEELWISTTIPPATTTTSGIVMLTDLPGVTNINDFSTVITPRTLHEWGNTRNFVSSGNFYQIMSQIFASADLQVPARIEQMSNFVWTAPVAQGQVMTLLAYDPINNIGSWTNSSAASVKATADWTSGGRLVQGEFGIVKIASKEEVMSGTTSTFEQMQSSGHIVPSLATLQSMIGEQYVSRIDETGASRTVSILSSIIGHGVAEGTTGSNIITVVNKNGLLIDHVINGSSAGANIAAGRVIVQDGVLISATINGFKRGDVYASGVVDVISAGKAYNLNVGQYGKVNVGLTETTSSSVESAVTASYGLTPHTTFQAGYDYYTRTGEEGSYTYHLAEVTIGNPVTISTFYHKYVGGEGHVTDIFMSGVYKSAGNWVAGNRSLPFNRVVVASNGLVHQIINGNALTPADASSVDTSGLFQGVVDVNYDGTIEHIRGNAMTQLNVNASGKVYHASLSGLSAGLTVMSGGYVEDCVAYSGSIITVSSGGVINGLTIFESASVIVEPAGTILGMIKYSPCFISSGKAGTESAYIQKVQFVKEDLLIYSNAVSSNVMSTASNGTTVFFTASAHPVGLRRESAGAVSVEHKFYPVAVETRVPNTSDAELNDYTINAEGLSLWTDMANTAVTWYVTF